MPKIINKISEIVGFNLIVETNKLEVNNPHSTIELSKKELNELIFELNEIAIRMK